MIGASSRPWAILGGVGECAREAGCPEGSGTAKVSAAAQARPTNWSASRVGSGAGSRAERRTQRVAAGMPMRWPGETYSGRTWDRVRTTAPTTLGLRVAAAGPPATNRPRRARRRAGSWRSRSSARRQQPEVRSEPQNSRVRESPGRRRSGGRASFSAVPGLEKGRRPRKLSSRARMEIGPSVRPGRSRRGRAREPEDQDGGDQPILPRLVGDVGAGHPSDGGRRPPDPKAGRSRCWRRIARCASRGQG